MLFWASQIDLLVLTWYEIPPISKRNWLLTTGVQVHTILIQKQPRVLYLPPSIIEGLCQIPSSLESMKNAESVLFTGGPLARPVGDMLSQHVKLSSSCTLFIKRLSWVLTLSKMAQQRWATSPVCCRKIVQTGNGWNGIQR